MAPVAKAAVIRRSPALALPTVLPIFTWGVPRRCFIVNHMALEPSGCTLNPCPGAVWCGPH
ncbi:hypothetical protein D3C75_1318310 [compost metagenome]